MPLSDEERRHLRDEEFYRNELRKEFAGTKPAPGFLERIATFFESKVGFWLLTTVFAGLSATLVTTVVNYLHRTEIEQRDRTERARRDLDTVLKIAPMLTSDNATQRQMGLSLLNGLALAKGIEPDIAAQITATLQSIVAGGVAPGASAEARSQANEVARLLDTPGPQAAAPTASPGPSATPGPRPTPAPVAAATVGAAVNAVQLPARVYVQIGSEAQRADAQRAVAALRDARILAPGIEVVAPRAVPRRNQLRYCDAKVVDEVRDEVARVLSSVITPLDNTPLPATLCGSTVRPNHFELWYGA